MLYVKTVFTYAIFPSNPKVKRTLYMYTVFEQEKINVLLVRYVCGTLQLYKIDPLTSYADHVSRTGDAPFPSKRTGKRR